MQKMWYVTLCGTEEQLFSVTWDPAQCLHFHIELQIKVTTVLSPSEITLLSSLKVAQPMVVHLQQELPCQRGIQAMQQPLLQSGSWLCREERSSLHGSLLFTFPQTVPSENMVQGELCKGELH